LWENKKEEKTNHHWSRRKGGKKKFKGDRAAPQIEKKNERHGETSLANKRRREGVQEILKKGTEISMARGQVKLKPTRIHRTITSRGKKKKTSITMQVKTQMGKEDVEGAEGRAGR